MTVSDVQDELALALSDARRCLEEMGGAPRKIGVGKNADKREALVDVIGTLKAAQARLAIVS